MKLTWENWFKYDFTQEQHKNSFFPENNIATQSTFTEKALWLVWYTLSTKSTDELTDVKQSTTKTNIEISLYEWVTDKKQYYQQLAS